jgi:hypothetical protein
MREQRKAMVGLVVALMVAAPAIVVRENIETVEAKAQTGPDTAAARWFSWSPEAQAEYVEGFVMGFREGEKKGCSYYADKITPYLPNKAATVNELPEVVCLDAMPDFVKLGHEYTDAITAYYKKYPSDRQAGMARLMKELATPPGLTIDQIHEKLMTGRVGGGRSK